MALPPPLSPGRSGFTSALQLAYDSGLGNARFGFGWSLGVPAVTRKQPLAPDLIDQTLGRHVPQVIGGTAYSGHALDRVIQRTVFPFMGEEAHSPRKHVSTIWPGHSKFLLGEPGSTCGNRHHNWAGGHGDYGIKLIRGSKLRKEH